MGSSSSKQQTLSVDQINAKSLSDATAQWNSTWYPQAQQYTRDYTDPKFTLAANNLEAAKTALGQQITSSAASTLSSANTYTDSQLGSYSTTADGKFATQSALTQAQNALESSLSSLQTTVGGNLDAAKSYADNQWTNDWSKAAQGYATTAKTEAQTYSDTALTNKFANDATFGQNLTVSGSLQAGSLQAGDSRIVNWAFFQKDNKGCLGYFDGETRKELLCLDTAGNLQDADGQYLFMLRSDKTNPLA